MGTVHITLYDNDRKNVANFACTTQFGNSLQDAASRISLPSNINREQYVCILADEQAREKEICKWIPYEEHSMKRYKDESRWSAGHSPCPPSECNNMDRSPSEALTWFLDFTYMYEFANIRGLDNWVKVGLHLAFCTMLVLVLILVLTKCLIPLACFSLSVSFKKKKGAKR
ncbi:unnamed protein product [Caenorhabditis auriculariae]|uniref:Uncharacterized protein n=1 Tax=Caenorhabditis auriculariae TaxID=2777116 RepID=A0A8S1HUD5_9PELO|nr:unnamed protein product [Caenorhabditis auriculariae]